MNDFDWRSDSDSPAPAKLTPVDDRLTADEAIRRTRKGEVLLYEGDFNNAKQLVAAMGRRMPKSAGSFKDERRTRQMEYDTLSRIVVALDKSYALTGLKRAPNVADACRQVWGEPKAATTVVALKGLLGMMGAAEWRKKGLVVPGLDGKLTPHYGVYTPTRNEYLELLKFLPSVEGLKVFDLGTGTGVLSFILLQRGAKHATGTDIDERAVACALANAKSLGLASQFTALQTEGFPDGKADLAICNPPWLPEAPKTRIDRAIFDEDNRFLLMFLEGLPRHAKQGVLIISNLAELFGLREPGWLQQQFDRVGLSLLAKHDQTPKHDRAYDKTNALHAARSKEVTSLYLLEPRGAPQ